jgi:hypothetical protein
MGAALTFILARCSLFQYFLRFCIVLVAGGEVFKLVIGFI